MSILRVRLSEFSWCIAIAMTTAYPSTISAQPAPMTGAPPTSNVQLEPKFVGTSVIPIAGPGVRRQVYLARKFANEPIVVTTVPIPNPPPRSMLDPHARFQPNLGNPVARPALIQSIQLDAVDEPIVTAPQAPVQSVVVRTGQ